MMKGLCTNCKRREKCKRLCAKALKYANEEYKETRELPVGKVKYLNYEEIWPEPTSKSESKLVYEMHFLDGMKVEDISFHITMAEEDIADIIYRLRNNVDKDITKKKNQILVLHFLKGLNLTQAAKIVGVSKPYAHYVISEYLENNGVT